MDGSDPRTDPQKGSAGGVFRFRKAPSYVTINGRNKFVVVVNRDLNWNHSMTRRLTTSS